jgi:lysophospholipase L1-like esterase
MSSIRLNHNHAWDAMLIRRFAADPNVTVIRIADLFATRDRLSPIDHFHPSAAGYALIAARIAPVL